jgi:hypothetical protein
MKTNGYGLIAVFAICFTAILIAAGAFEAWVKVAGY